MINLTEIEYRLQAHQTRIDRINRRERPWECGAPGAQCGAGTGNGRRIAAIDYGALAMRRAAGRLLALLPSRGAGPSRPLARRHADGRP